MSPKIVCFDLGGVMVQIAGTWKQAAVNAGLTAEVKATAFSDIGFFDRFQAGAVSQGDYLEALSGALGIDATLCASAHNGIIQAEYPGIPDLVGRLRERGVRTGCLSNTNELHWELMTRPDLFPTVASLDVKVASHLVRSCKPDPAIYQDFEDQAGLRGGEVVYFDDVPQFVEAGLSRGWRAFKIDPNAGPSAQMGAILVELGLI